MLLDPKRESKSRRAVASVLPTAPLLPGASTFSAGSRDTCALPHVGGCMPLVAAAPTRVLRFGVRGSISGTGIGESPATVKSPNPSLRGFSMVELLVAISIVAILAGLAGPSLSTFMRNSRLSTTANLLLADLQLARREAIKRNMSVLVVPKGSGAAAWSSGWNVCYTLNPGAGSCDAPPADNSNPNPIRSRKALDSSLSLALAPTASAPVRFNANGSQGDPTNAVTQAFTLSASGSSRTYTGRVTATGSITMGKSS